MPIAGTLFVSHVKAKLNRIDSNAYQDVRQEEVIFFANDAIKSLTLEFDAGQYSQILDARAIAVYLADLVKVQSELPLTNNAGAIVDDVFKYKDVEVFVTKDSESGWVPANRARKSDKNSDNEDNPFQRSFMDNPAYRLIDGNIQFDAQDFSCTKYRYKYLAFPDEILLASTLDYSFIEELEDKTVTLILENLEAQRLRTQPLVSRS